MTTLLDHLFVSSCDGALHDTRIADWHKLPPLRANYARTHGRIRSAADLKATLRAGAYAWPGGYPLYFLTSDGGALSFATVRDNLARVLDSIATGTNDGWRVVDNHHLERAYSFADFKAALDFTNAVGELAEAEGHHPDIYLAWGKAKVTIWTHKIDGLTESDFILAAKAEQIYESTH